MHKLVTIKLAGSSPVYHLQDDLSRGWQIQSITGIPVAPAEGGKSTKSGEGRAYMAVVLSNATSPTGTGPEWRD